MDKAAIITAVAMEHKAVEEKRKNGKYAYENPFTLALRRAIEDRQDS